MYEGSPLSHHEETSLLAQRASLLSAVNFSTSWHADTLRDSEATHLEKRQSRDRKREIIQRLVAFDQRYPEVAHLTITPEE